MRVVMPAWRRARASCSCTTPSQSAPPATAACAEGIMPWPYPSALTTAISWVPPTCPRIASTLRATAARSMSASA